MKRKNRTSIALLLALVCLVLLGTGTYAAYTNVSFIKRVVATRSGAQGSPFSSNYLMPSSGIEEANFAHKLISAGADGTATISLTVCNYPQNDITKYSDSDIPYTLTVQVFDSENKEVKDSAILGNITIDNTALASSYSHPSTLKGGQKSMDVYHIKIQNCNVLSQYTIRIKAVPDGIEGFLAANFKVVAASKQPTGWTGEFVDSNKSLAELDAFNYKISGSAKGSLTLSWDKDYIMLSRWSIKALGEDPADVTNSITFSVGGDGQPGSYLLQFYRVKGYSTGDAWPTVDYTFVETP